MLAKGRTHAISHDEPFRPNNLLANAKRGHAVALYDRGARGGTRDKRGPGGGGGLYQLRIEPKARQGGAHLGRIGLRPRGGDVPAVAVQFKSAVAVGGVNRDAELV